MKKTVMIACVLVSGCAMWGAPPPVEAYKSPDQRQCEYEAASATSNSKDNFFALAEKQRQLIAMCMQAKGAVR